MALEGWLRNIAGDISWPWMVSKGAMRILLATCMATIALAQPAGDCVPGSLGNYDVTTRWNKAAKDGNAYVELKQAGKIDYKLRAQFEKEMKAVFKCECW